MPAWELGDIPPGGSAQVLMNFLIKAYGGGPAEMPFADIRHGVLRHSLINGSDVLYNRSESLKISHWLDLILVDIGTSVISIPYPGQEPVEYVYASDVSVFFDSAARGPARAEHHAGVQQPDVERHSTELDSNRRGALPAAILR